MGGYYSYFWGTQKTPEENLKEVKKLVRTGKRTLEREIVSLNNLEGQTKNQVRNMVKQGQSENARIVVKEIVNIRKQRERLENAVSKLLQVLNQLQSLRVNQVLESTLKNAAKSMYALNSNLNVCFLLNLFFSDFFTQSSRFPSSAK